MKQSVQPVWKLQAVIWFDKDTHGCVSDSNS